MAPAQRLDGFDWLRCYAILAVVCIHVTDVALRKNDYFPAPTTEGALYFMTSAWFRFCVPVFFMMSAFLQETRMLKGGPRPATRWRRFLFPLVVASLVYTVVNVVTAKALHKPIVPLGYLVAALAGGAAVHTYFLFNLMIYALVHHHLRRLASNGIFALLVAIYSLLFALTLGRGGWLSPDNSFAGAFVTVCLAAIYYLAGIWAARNVSRLSAVGRPFAWGALVAGLVLAAIYGVFVRERGFYNPATELLAAATFLLALGTRRPPPPFVRLLATYSLGIYLWHLAFLGVARVAEGRFYRQAFSPAITFGIVVLEVLLGLFGGLAVSLVLARSEKLSGLAR